MTDHQVAVTDRLESRSGAQLHASRLWADSNTGDWDSDNTTGRGLADALIKSFTAGKSPTLLGHTVKAMIELGHYGGVECGFCHRIAEHLIVGT